MALQLVNGQVEELLGKILNFPDDGEEVPIRSKFRARLGRKITTPSELHLPVRLLYFFSSVSLVFVFSRVGTRTRDQSEKESRISSLF